MERWHRLLAPSPTWAKLTQLHKREHPVSSQEAMGSLQSRPNFQQFARVIKAHCILKRMSTLQWHLESNHSDINYSASLARKLLTWDHPVILRGPLWLRLVYRSNWEALSIQRLPFPRLIVSELFARHLELEARIRSGMSQWWSAST